MTDLALGTMGFGYRDWAGVFYPAGMRAGDYLSYYSRYFGAVELDTTFHATPPAPRVERWRDVTPDGFLFCPKTPRAITHEGSLDHRMREMGAFIDVMRVLGKKLAAVLIQLPPACGIDQFESLERFIKGLPRDIRFAIELRSTSWGQQRTLDLLREHHCALVSAEYLDRPSRIYVTSDFLYLRWIGEHERFEELNREQLDVSPQLEWWKGEIERVRGSGQVKQVFGFFNNDYTGYAIETCRRFMRMMGQAVLEDPDQSAAHQQQGELFG